MEVEWKIPPLKSIFFFQIYFLSWSFLFVCGGLDLKKVSSLIEGKAYTSEVQKIYRPMRLIMKLRSKPKASELSTFWPNFVNLNGCQFLNILGLFLCLSLIFVNINVC